MADPRELARLLGDLEDQLVVCMRCGLCQSVCPLYAQTGRESDVARGKLALLDGLAKEMLRDAGAVQERLNKCLLCGSCAANCPSGVKSLDIFLKARAVLAGYQGLSPAKKLIFRGLLTRPALFNLLASLAGRLQGVMGRPASELLGTSCARLTSPLGDRHFRRLAAKPLHALIPQMDTPPAPGKPRVAFFVGCLVDKLYPRVGQAVVKALTHHGVGLAIPPAQACCGMPALSAGDSQAFEQMLTHNLAHLRPGNFDYLVTACATCTSAIKKLWPLMAQGLNAGQRAQVERLSRKTIDISQFLVDKLLVGNTICPEDHEGRAITYHDPCHLKKSLGVAAQPRKLLAASPGQRLVEMAEADWCCGMGGSFNLLHYEQSAAIGRRKLENIKASGCQAVATSCPACMAQISDALSQDGQAIAVRHVIEVYAQALGPGGKAG
ncbi:MAG: (Fe-S)-binding protein [Desulfarculus sp.]|nr:(Fe-S)-binding protein [Desulfarculus sp.]